MNLVYLPLTQLKEASWNPNQMGLAMLTKLRESITRYGLVENLVVRPMDGGCYEVLSGNQRLQALRESGIPTVPCVVVNLNDAHARLLSQALNRIQGQDDLGLRAELFKEVLKTLPQQEVLSLLPETTQGLKAMVSLGQDDIASYLQNWQQAQEARLKHLAFQFTPAQLEVVEEALSRVMSLAREAQGDTPNIRGTALYLLCESYLKQQGGAA
jgi:ParB family transcriptional regulator, chromosome partitioning protein